MLFGGLISFYGFFYYSSDLFLGPVQKPQIRIASSLPSQDLDLPPVPHVTPIGSIQQQDQAEEKLGARFSAPGLEEAEQASLWKTFSEARRKIELLTETQVSLPINQGVRLFAQHPGQKLTARFLDDGVRIQSGRKAGQTITNARKGCIDEASDLLYGLNGQSILAATAGGALSGVASGITAPVAAGFTSSTEQVLFSGLQNTITGGIGIQTEIIINGF